MVHEVRANIDFLDDLGDIEHTRYEAIERRLVQLKYVTEAWIDHSCIVVAGFETPRFDVAERRLAVLKGKVSRLLNRYRGKDV
jgi:hypothetical protein